MSSAVDKLPSVHYSSAILPVKSLPKYNILINKDEHIVDQLTDRVKSSCWVYGNGRG